MTRPAPVARRALEDRRVALAWWAVGITLYTALIMAVWPVIEGNEEFADLAQSYPDSIKALMGGAEAFDAFTTPTGFLDSYLYSMILPFIFVGLAVSMGAALLAGDEEAGLLELLLSHPVGRASAAVQKSGAMAAATVGLGGVVVVVIWVAGSLVDLRVGVGALLAATVGTVLFALVHGQLALLAGAVGGSKGLALGVGWGVALGGYLFDVLAGIDESYDWLRWASPLHWATAGSPIDHGLPAGYLALLGALALALAATVVAFRRHELS